MSKADRSKFFYGEGLPGLNAHELKGHFIVIEGADGAGRKTQLDLLHAFLENEGYAVVPMHILDSELVKNELVSALQGNVITQRTLTLFYATALADQLEKVVVPALRSDFVVLACGYIYSLIAKAVVRKIDKQWLDSLFGFALVPDHVLFLDVTPEILCKRYLNNHDELNYWSSGMDLGLSSNAYASFIRYQTLLRNEFHSLNEKFTLEMIDGDRSIQEIAKQVQTSVLDNILVK